MRQRRTIVLVLGMGSLLMGLLALQFSWIRALVDARTTLFDEQARTALVEVQSILDLSGAVFPPIPTGGLAPATGPAADSLAARRADAAIQREYSMAVVDSLLSAVLRNRDVDFEFRSALLDRYGRPLFLQDVDVDWLDQFAEAGYRIPVGENETLEGV